MGLVVDQIVDIVEDTLHVEVGGDTPGVLGSAVIKGQATELLDVGHYLPLAFEDWLTRKDKKVAAARTLLFVDDFGVLPQYAHPGAAGGGLQRHGRATR